jgi:hypothetical protein
MNRRIRKLLVTGLLGGVVAGAMIVPAITLAGPTVPSDPPMPPLHRHYLVLPDGSTHEVGPDWCDNQSDPAMMLAFYNFHYNIHASGGAPGLHNGKPADIYGHPGCGPIPATGPTS